MRNYYNMKNRKEYASWAGNICCYCCGHADTVDHVPSKVLLEEPYPANLLTVPCCKECNESFSKDEEYVAVLMECVECQSFNSKDFRRDRIRRIIEHTPSLISKVRLNVIPCFDGSFTINCDDRRLRNVIYKLCVGHLRYEGLYLETTMNQYDVNIFSDVMKEFLDDFMMPIHSEQLPEVGSRSLSEILIMDGEYCSPWHEVQPHMYYYCVAHDLSEVRILIHDYFAVKVSLNHKF